MNESFNKFKKKLLFEALIKSVVISLAVGLICFTVPYLIIKFTKVEINPNYLVFLLLAATSVASIVFGLLFLILFPRKIKVAKRLDKQLDLKQKVQTMVEYENEDNPMVNLQRQDTLNILSNISLKKFAMKFSAFFFVLVGFAFVLSTTVIVVNAVEKLTDEPSEVEGPKYDLDNWTVRALLDLIEIVETSSIQEDLKTPVVNNLKALLESLEDVELESEMKDLVKEVIDDADLRLDLINSNNEVFTVLKTSNSNVVVDLGTHINALNVTNINNSIENLYVYLTGDPATVLGALADFDNDLRVLINSSALNKEEALVSAILKLASDLKECENSDSINESIKTAINSNKDNILNIIKLQAENKRIIEYTIEQLEIIFGLKESSNTDQTDPGTSKPTINPVEPPKINPDENQGGYGTGEELFGSDDIMFDAEEGSVKYGEVIDKYYGELVGMFNDGTLPEEYKEFFEKYFNKLFGSIEDEETN